MWPAAALPRRASPKSPALVVRPRRPDPCTTVPDRPDPHRTQVDLRELEALAGRPERSGRHHQRFQRITARRTSSRTSARPETPQQFECLADLLDARRIVVGVQRLAQPAVPASPMPRRESRGDLGSGAQDRFGVEWSARPRSRPTDQTDQRALPRRPLEAHHRKSPHRPERDRVREHRERSPTPFAMPRDPFGDRRHPRRQQPTPQRRTGKRSSRGARKFLRGDVALTTHAHNLGVRGDARLTVHRRVVGCAPEGCADIAVLLASASADSPFGSDARIGQPVEGCHGDCSFDVDGFAGARLGRGARCAADGGPW